MDRGHARAPEPACGRWPVKAAESHLGGVETHDGLVTHDRGSMVDAAGHLHPVAGAENGEVARHHHAETARENGVDLVKTVRVLRKRGAGG